MKNFVMYLGLVQIALGFGIMVFYSVLSLPQSQHNAFGKREHERIIREPHQSVSFLSAYILGISLIISGVLLGAGWMNPLQIGVGIWILLASMGIVTVIELVRTRDI